jgi:seryl-tRNA synthetase
MLNSQFIYILTKKQKQVEEIKNKLKKTQNEGSYYHPFIPSLVNLGVPESSSERTNNLLEKVLHNQEKVNKLGAEPNAHRTTTASVPITTAPTPENVLPLQTTTEIQSTPRQRSSRIPRQRQTRIPRASDNRERVLNPATGRMVLKGTLERKDREAHRNRVNRENNE